MGGGAQANMTHPEDSVILVGAYSHPELLAHTPSGAGGGVDCTKSGVHVMHLSGATGKLTHLTTNAIGAYKPPPSRCTVCRRLVVTVTEDESLFVLTRFLEQQNDHC
jgi:hypothetical protein